MAMSTRAGAARSPRVWFNTAAVQIPVMVLLFTLAAVYEAFHISALSSPDIWWHLSTGLWILQNRAVPQQGLFSQFPDVPWIASSWGYEVLAAAVYKLLGLRGIPVLLMVLKAGLAVVTFLLARGWRGNFWPAVLLSAAAQYVIADLQPLPVVFSIIFFGAELILLFQAHRTGSVRALYGLPLLFFLWANLHIQFVNGLCLLGLFLLAEVAERFLREDHCMAPPLGALGAVLGLSVAASLLTPYSFHLFPDALRDVYGKAAFQYFSEMRPMGFRRPQDYVLLLLVMWAFLGLGRKRTWDLLKLSLMTAGTLIAFRIARDGWCAVLPATAVLADVLNVEGSVPGTPNGVGEWKWGKPLLVSSLVPLVLLLSGTRVPADRNTLLEKVATTFPVRACDFIREKRLPSPLFNSYEWGGFLTWYLPEYPVAMDDRLGLYGQEITSQYFDTIQGRRLDAASTFTGARILLLQRQSGIARGITTFPDLSSQYHVRYSDELAVVLERR